MKTLLLPLLLPAFLFAAECVTTFEQFQSQLTAYGSAASDVTVEVCGSFTLDALVSIPSNSVGKTLSITSGTGTTHTLTRGIVGNLFTVPSGAKLILENIIIDGDRNGEFATNSGGPLIRVNNNGTLTMNDGAILCNNDHTTQGVSYGGGVYVTGANSTFNMKGGKIIGNAAGSNGSGGTMNRYGYGGGVYAENGSTFTMSGGEISQNTTSAPNGGNGSGVYIATNSTFTMNGGKISGNTSNSSGGGVYIISSTFTMSGGEISGNTVTSSGGGVYVSTSGTFTMNGGKISGNTVTNTSSGGGGGVYNNGSNNNKFTMNGGEISRNIARNNVGREVFNTASSKFDMTGGVIFGEGTGNAVINGTYTLNAGDPPAPNNGVIIAWNNVSGIYKEGDSVSLNVLPAEATAFWSVQGGTPGVYYKNGYNDGFIETEEQRFTITQEMIDTIPDQRYTGEAIEPKIHIISNGRLLEQGKDYNVSHSSNTAVGSKTAKAAITGKGIYATAPATINLTFSIVQTIAQIPITITWNPTSFTYSGSPQQPIPAALHNGVPVPFNVTVSGGSAINAGTYTATASTDNPAHNLMGSTATFTISKATLLASLSIANIKEGGTLSPSIAGNKSGGAVSYLYSTSESGTYTQEVPKAKGIYFAKATIAETANYLAFTTPIVSFAITNPNPAPVTVKWVGTSFLYNGMEQSPAATASLPDGTKFDLIISGATDAGSHTATARFAVQSLDYELKDFTTQFFITPKALTENNIDPIAHTYFADMQIKPGVTVRDGGNTLVPDVDYGVDYGENIIGNGTVTVTGKGNYAGSAQRKFYIYPHNAKVVTVEWSDENPAFSYDGLEHAPTATAADGTPIKVTGGQSNAGTYVAMAELETQDMQTILTNQLKNYTISKKPLTVSWTPERKFTYNKMVQVPTPSVPETGVELRVVNAYSSAGVYSGVLAPFAQIISSNANNYELKNHTISSYEIEKKGLQPYFSTTLPSFRTNASRDTIEVPSEVFTDPDALNKILESILDYDGFATDSKGESDNASVFKSKPSIKINYSNSQGQNSNAKILAKRVQTTQTATAVIATDNVLADNYVLARPAIAIMETIDDEGDTDIVFCNRTNANGSYCAELSEEVCRFVGGTVAATSCGTARKACVIDETRCVSNMLLDACKNIGGTTVENCETPILSMQGKSTAPRIWQTASGVVNVDLGYMPSAPVALEIYDLKGKLVAAEQVNTRFASVGVNASSGVYLFKVGRSFLLYQLCKL